MKSLFMRKMDPRCVYCALGRSLNAKEVACVRQGVVGAYDRCRSFRYDALKRVPAKPEKLGRDYGDGDFTL
ncbi:MAG: hypothetical protein LBR72_01725 [Oscillospiraceae bacterium]|nr:hypothetical protein [Oscillospiraceae bacterium]